MLWYYADENAQQIGPLTPEAFNDAVAQGTVRPETLVWNEDLTEWKPYSSLNPAILATSPVGLEDGQAACHECGNTFPASELIEFEGSYICATCKPAFFQRLSEGGVILTGGGTGTTINADLTAAARATLSGQWGLGVGFNFLYNAITQSMGFVPYLGSIAAFICSPALAVGSARFHVALARGTEARIGMMFDGFKNLGTAFLAMFLMTLYILLWSLLLIIPGIMAAYSYMMIYYIISDDPTITASEALRRSKRMMYGNRMKLFCLFWRFFGWSLLCILTLGIGLLWLLPYINTTLALFYEDVRGLAEE